MRRSAAQQWTGMRSVVVVAVLVSLPLFTGDPQWFQWATIAALFTMWNISLNMIWGYAGAMSLAQLAMGAISGYTVVILLNRAGLALVPAVLIAIGAAVAVSLLLSGAALRLGGYYFAVLTVTVGSLVATIAANLDITGRSSGLLVPLRVLPELSVGSWTWDLKARDGGFYALVAVVLVIVYALSLFVARSRVGGAMFALRDDPALSAALGINALQVRSLAFALSAVVAACAGILQAFHYQLVVPQLYSLDQALVSLMLLVIGGLGRVSGPVIGGLVYLLLYQVLPIEGLWRQGILGVAVILIMLFFPRGIAGVFDRMPMRLASRWPGQASIIRRRGVTPRNIAPLTKGGRE